MKIRITEQHIYLDDYDISPFVVGGSLKIDGEQVIVRLIGDVKDEREPKKPARKKEVEHGDGSNGS